MSINAVGTQHWMKFLYARGYDVRPEDVPCPAMRELEGFEGSDAELAALRMRLSLEIQYERFCLREARARRAWAGEPCAKEQAEAARIERERLAREQAIEARTQQLLAADETKRLEAARKRARAEAEKEAVQ